MSRIDVLIRELCPEGVPSLPLLEVCEQVLVPMRDRPKDLSGDIPWCRIEDIAGHRLVGSKTGLGVSLTAVKELNLKVFPAGTVVASCSASLGTYAIAERPLITNQTFIGLVCGSRMINKFLLYLLTTMTGAIRKLASTGTIPYVSREKFERLIVPVPPLEVQREIVSILDKFTQLEAELEAELEARRTQYEVTRDRLLDFSGELSAHPMGELIRELCPEGVPSHPLDELFDIRGGYTPSKANSAFWTDGTIPWFRMEDIRQTGRLLFDSIQHVSESAIKKGGPFEEDSIIVATTATIGEHALVRVPFLANQQFSILTRKPDFKGWLDAKFAYYIGFLLSDYCLKNTNISGFASVNMESFRNFPFPLPPLEVQREIVSVLDKLDALVNDITYGLPAELEARRKQYEYYRNKLLTFKELDAA